MIVLGLAMWALGLVRIGTEMRRAIAQVRKDLLRALVATQSWQAAREAGEYVVLIQSANLKGARRPGLIAELAFDPIGAVDAAQAHAVYEMVPICNARTDLNHYFCIGLLVFDGREEQCSIHQRKPIVYPHHTATHDTIDFPNVQRAKVRQDKAPDLIVAEWPLVFQSYVDRVLLVDRHSFENRPVVTLVKHVTSSVQLLFELLDLKLRIESDLQRRVVVDERGDQVACAGSFHRRIVEALLLLLLLLEHAFPNVRRACCVLHDARIRGVHGA